MKSTATVPTEPTYQDLIEENEHLLERNRELAAQLERGGGADASVDVELEIQLNQLMTFQNENIKDGLTMIQSDLAGSVTSSKGALSAVNKEFTELSQKTDKISKNLDDVWELASESGKTVATLSSRADEIKSILGLIRGIAQQTNLLSLNAAIEAARAGEHGRGFAVVADEVRGLADKTQEAIRQTNDVIEAMYENVQSVTTSSGQVIENMQSVNSEVAELRRDMEQTRNHTNSHFGEISDMTDSVFMSLAKLDHILWKVNTYLSVNKGEPAFEFVSHHHCRLGKWYDVGEGRQLFSGSEHYSSLEPPHAAVHNGTHDVFNLIGKGSRDYPALMRAFATMEANSHEVFEILDRIQRSKSGRKD